MWGLYAGSEINRLQIYNSYGRFIHSTGERVLATPVSRRLSERPSPRRRRAGQPRRVGRGGCLRGIARRLAGTRQMEMWGLWVFRAARSRAGLGAGDLSVRAEGPRFEDGR